MSKFRIEKDSIGERAIPIEAYYGIQSMRAKENFYITDEHLDKELIVSLAEVKKAAALVNMEVEELSTTIGEPIVEACDEIIAGNYHEEFIVDPIQGGAGTSANMNANEVIANIAIEKMGRKKGDYKVVNPNDHVNMGQSTNDVYPSSGKITLVKKVMKLIEKLDELYFALDKKAREFENVIKMGRTQLEDAVPITLGQEFTAYKHAIGRDIKRLQFAREDLRILNLGGTAIGTSLNANVEYVKKVVPKLCEITELDLVQAEDLIDSTQNLDIFVITSGIIKSCAVNVSKISNDLRLMNSGPRAGIGEINLPAKQAGSSIMPGKINPVIPEVVNQVAFQIIGNDMAITMAAEAGQLELNAFEPIIFYQLFKSLDFLTNAVDTFTKNAIQGITANEKVSRRLVDQSVGMITAITPYVGYEVAARVAKEALREGHTIKELILKEQLLPEDKVDEILDPFKMIKLE